MGFWWDFDGILLDFDGILMGLASDSMVIQWGLMVLYSDLVDNEWDTPFGNST